MNLSSILPTPRACLLDNFLVRPDWTKSSTRDPSLLWLDKNENTDPQLQEFIKTILHEISKNSLFTYPDPYFVYQKIAKYAGVSIENILITPGSDGVIRSVFETFINEGDIVLHTSPTFAMYPVYCKIFGARPITLNYIRKNDEPYLCFENILKHLSDFKPKLICLPNPDSPTGTTFPNNQIKQIVKQASLQGTIVLIDEAYFEFYKSSVVEMLNDYKNLIIARTFAKAWGLAGLRIGYSLASPEITKYLHKIKPMYEVGNFSLSFMDIMLSYEDEMKASVDRLLEGKNYFSSSMTSLGFKTLKNYGNFQHVNFGDKREKIHQILADLVLYRKDFSDECLKDYSRFSITTKDIFSKIVSRIKENIL